MKYTAIIAVLLTASNAQDFGPKANCSRFKDIKLIPDPFYMFEPGKADFHCDMGVAVPFGPVPTGCAKLEVIVGECGVWLLCYFSIRVHCDISKTLRSMVSKACALADEIQLVGPANQG
jgi:hypothetical protein